MLVADLVMGGLSAPALVAVGGDVVVAESAAVGDCQIPWAVLARALVRAEMHEANRVPKRHRKPDTSTWRDPRR